MGLGAKDIDVTQPLNTMGLDSRMVVELKNRIETDHATNSLVHERAKRLELVRSRYQHVRQRRDPDCQRFTD